jgi:hypothetical protein
MRTCQSFQKNRFYNFQSAQLKQLLKLYHEAEQKINEDLNVVKLIKNLRDMRILVNSHLMDRKTKFQIEHSKKNIINIESSVESHSSNSIGSSHDDI